MERTEPNSFVGSGDNHFIINSNERGYENHRNANEDKNKIRTPLALTEQIKTELTGSDYLSKQQST